MSFEKLKPSQLFENVHPSLRKYYTPNFAEPYDEKKAKEMREMIKWLKSRGEI